jgi:hypothetical protein
MGGRVAGRLAPLPEPLGQALGPLRMGRLARDAARLIRVRAHVVQLRRRTRLLENTMLRLRQRARLVERVQVVPRRIGPQHRIPPLRVAVGHEPPLVGAHAADVRVGIVPVAHRVDALAAFGGLVGEHLRDALAGHGLLGNANARRLQERRRQVDRAGEAVIRHARVHPRPLNNQGRAHPCVVDRPFGAWKRRPVVAHEHHERVFPQAALLQFIKVVPDLHVHRGDGIVVVGQVPARVRAVRQVRRHGHRIRVGGFLDGRRVGREIPERAVRLQKARPHQKGRARGLFVEKGAQVLGAGGAPLVVPPVELVARRAVRLADQAGEVAGPLRKKRRQRAHRVGDGHVQVLGVGLVRVAPRDHRDARRAARGGRQEGALDFEAALGELVDVGRASHVRAVRADVAPAEVIGDEDEDAGPLGFFARGRVVLRAGGGGRYSSTPQKQGGSGERKRKTAGHLGSAGAWECGSKKQIRPPA